jgi:cytochrome c-type biogenesis protein CcmH
VRIAALAVAAALVMLAAPAASAAAPRTNLADVEDEVMCPICGTLLELSDSPQAQRERALIQRLIVRGRSKEQIKDRLVAEYGPGVLATPDDSGFDLTAWLVPIVAFIVAAAAVGIGVTRWRRSTRLGDDGREPPPLGDEEAERLESDLARYDL